MANSDFTSMEDGKWSEIPQMPAGTLSVTLNSASIEYGKRYLLTVNYNGTPHVQEIPENAAIASAERYLEMMLEPNGSYVPDDVLERFIDAARIKLERRKNRHSAVSAALQ